MCIFLGGYLGIYLNIPICFKLIVDKRFMYDNLKTVQILRKLINKNDP